MFCHKCGTKIADGATFCHKCGTKVVYEEAAPQTTDTLISTPEPAIPSSPAAATTPKLESQAVSLVKGEQRPANQDEQTGLSLAEAGATPETFDVTLCAVANEHKIRVIKEVRVWTGLSLHDAKELVENVPAVLKRAVTREDADLAKRVFTKAGATVSFTNQRGEPKEIPIHPECEESNPQPMDTPDSTEPEVSSDNSPGINEHNDELLDHFGRMDWLKDWFEEEFKFGVEDWFDTFKEMSAVKKVIVFVVVIFVALVFAALLKAIFSSALLLVITLVGGCIAYYKLGLTCTTAYVYERKSKKLKLPTGMTAQTLLEELNRKLNYPYFKGVRYGESGECMIEGKYSVYPVTFKENGTAYLSYKPLEDDKKLRVVMLEAIAIRSYINKFFNPDLPVDAVEDLKTLQSAEKQYKSAAFVVSVVSAIATLIMVVIAVDYAAPGTLQRIAKPGIEVRTAYLSQYSKTITIEDAFENFFDDGKWSTYRENDYSYVAFTGVCEYLEERADVKVRFKITGERFSVDSLDINGQRQGDLILYALLSKIYEDY